MTQRGAEIAGGAERPATARCSIVVHGYGSYALLYRHMIELAKSTAPDVEWAIILPTSHHLDAVREILDDTRILCLENEQARSFPEVEDLSELAGYDGNIYADIEAEKKIFKHRRGIEQVTRAVEIYRIYKRFLQQSGTTHVLLANIETFEGKMLVSLANELGMIPMVPTDCRNLGGIFFSASAGEGLPDYRCLRPELIQQASSFLADFRKDPKPALSPLSDGLAAEKPLSLHRKALLQRGWAFLRRTLKNPRLFEPVLLKISLQYTFPRLREAVRGMRSRRNARQFDIGSLDALPQKFLYYPLQTTPESSINTPAPYYIDQMRAIDALRFSMPSEFTLLVKEHPASIGIRPADFYKSLRRKAGVRIAHVSLPSLDLIRRAGMTISVTGTATFEAFLLGRPSLVLGGSFIADYLGGVCSIEDLPDRIAQGLRQPPTDEQIVEAIAEVMSVRYGCIFRPPDEAGQLATRPSNIRRLLHAVLDHIDNLRRTGKAPGHAHRYAPEGSP